MNDIVWVITCEHASHALPKKYVSFFPEREMHSHKGFDLGAAAYAGRLSQELSGKLFCGKYSRLLIDLNRSLHNPALFSHYTKSFSSSEKKKLVRSLYMPFRKSVEEYIKKALSRKKYVVHFSCHSFSPELHGVERGMDVGILYDPQRPLEQKLAGILQKELKKHTSMCVRLNAPYRGKSDGHTTALRLLFSREMYIGIEIEVNQRLFHKDLKPLWEHLWFPIFVQSCHVLETTCL